MEGAERGEEEERRRERVSGRGVWGGGLNGKQRVGVEKMLKTPEKMRKKSSVICFLKDEASSHF